MVASRAMRHVVLFASAFALLVTACGGSPEPKAAAGPKTSTTSASTPPPSDPMTKPRAPITELKRADVKTAINRGLGVFLQNVMVEDYPAMKDGRFYGFRLKALNPDWGVDLRPGDVIVRVNGQVIEHPEEADAALRSLEKAPSLKIDYEREGKMRTLELPIVD
jgi:type II secretory pathway component PulC